MEFCNAHAMEWSIVRPVLVHGPGVGGNFGQLIRLVDSQIPLPFGAIRNRRSLLSVGNLAAFLVGASRHCYLMNRIVNLADEPAHSTPSLVRSLADALGRRARLLPVPSRTLELAATLVGREPAVRRVTRSLQVDTAQLVREMPWHPPLSWEQALQETVADAVRRR
jgi:UDP-glucose 4-epimerase